MDSKLAALIDDWFAALDRGDQTEARKLVAEIRELLRQRRFRLLAMELVALQSQIEDDPRGRLRRGVLHQPASAMRDFFWWWLALCLLAVRQKAQRALLHERRAEIARRAIDAGIPPSFASALGPVLVSAAIFMECDADVDATRAAMDATDEIYWVLDPARWAVDAPAPVPESLDSTTI